MINNNISHYVDMRSFPVRTRQPFPFWTAPVKVGIYGDGFANVLVVIGNHEPTLVRLGRLLNQQENAGTLVLQTGGMPLSVAIQFNLVDEQAFHLALRQLAGQQYAQGTRILLPYSLALRMGLLETKRFEEFRIQIIPDNFSALEAHLKDPELQFSQGKPTALSAVLLRLFTGLRFFVGQFILFALPLFIFGRQSLSFGIASLLLSALITSLLWHVLPGSGLVKGMIVGGMLAVLVGLVLVTLGNLGWTEILRFGFGFLLSGSWMGLVLNGTGVPHTSKE